MELTTFEALGYVFAAKLAWLLLVFLKNLLTGWGLCGSVDPKSLGDWAVGASIARCLRCLSGRQVVAADRNRPA
jgi:hypothetical protein